MEQEKPKAYIAPDIVLRLLINKNDRAKSQEILTQEKMQIVTSLFCMYEAVACVKDADELDLNMLLLILKHCAFVPMEIDNELKAHYKMSAERKQKLRELALKKEGVK